MVLFQAINKYIFGACVLLIWDEFLKILKEEAGSQIVETWFKAVTFEEWDPGTHTVILRAPNQFIRTWIQDHYAELLKKHLARLLYADNIQLMIIGAQQEKPNERTIIPASVVQKNSFGHAQQNITQQQNNNNHNNYTGNTYRHTQEPYNTSTFTPTSTSLSPSHNQTGYPGSQTTSHDGHNKLRVIEKKTKERTTCNLNENYRFDNFIAGPSNSLAHAAAYAICENVGRVYNPLFIYGGTGLGKTHLLHAIGNEVKRQHPSLVVRYETSDHFINDFINCIRFDRSQQFRSKYQKIDVLLFDDIQFLSNKEQTQETFFHVFNVLHEQQKQIVLSSDTFPKEITGLQSRLKSRMEWGLVADIQTPDLETKIAILKKKSELHGVPLADDVAEFIASRVLSNIRELEGALIRVSAFSALTNQTITLDLARRVLLNLQEKRPEGVSLDNILKIVCKNFSISITDIKSKSRQKDISSVRQVALFLMKKTTFCSLQAIGSFVGGRDHSTVIHAITKIEHLINNDSSFAQKIKAIEQEILMG